LSASVQGTPTRMSGPSQPERAVDDRPDPSRNMPQTNTRTPADESPHSRDHDRDPCIKETFLD
jgi:hypothetical protein